MIDKIRKFLSRLRNKFPDKHYIIKELKCFAVILVLLTALSLISKNIPHGFREILMGATTAIGFTLWKHYEGPLVKNIIPSPERLAEDPELLAAVEIVLDRMHPSGIIVPKKEDVCPEDQTFHDLCKKLQDSVPEYPCLN